MLINGIDKAQTIQPSVTRKAENFNKESPIIKKTEGDVFEKNTKNNILKDMNIWGFEPQKKGIISEEEILSHAKLFLSKFNNDLYGMLKPLGINTEQEIELSVQAGSGKIIVKNDHPDKEKIEKIFENHPEFGNEYRKITSMFEIYESGKEALEFQKAYEKNQEEAVARYYYLFHTNLSADITFTSEGAEVDFTRTDKKSGSYVSDYQKASYYISSK